MILLNPIWLSALAAVCIPVLIHLWNIRNGKVLKVGSISLITAASRKSSRSLNLLDLLLLLLRCLLLIILTFLLARPLFKQSNNASNVKGWILIPKEDFSQAYAKFKAAIDSLSAKGYECHYFNKGFASADIRQQRSAKNISSTNSPGQKQVTFNALLWQLQRKLPAGFPVFLFTDNRSSRFSDQRSPVALNLKWRLFTPSDSVRRWIQAAWFNAGKDVMTIAAKSTPSVTSYSRYAVKANENRDNPFQVYLKDGISYIRIKDSESQAIKIDTTESQMAVYEDHYAADAAYLEAALHADLAFLPYRTRIRTYKRPEAIPAGQDWLFWLSDKPVPPLLRQHARNLLAYMPGKASAVDSWIAITSAHYGASEPNIPLFKITDAAKTGQVLWSDGFGAAVLSRENQDSTASYHFYTHFSPDWNNLVWTNEFPEILLNLITAARTQTAYAGLLSSIDQYQLPPVTGAMNSNDWAPSALKDYTRYIWLALIVVFLTERWVAHRQKRVQSNA